VTTADTGASPYTPYEQARLAELQQWLAKPPGLVARGFGRTTSPLVRAIKPWAPEAALQRAFSLASQAGSRPAWRKQMLSDLALDEAAALRDWPLEDCDDIWRKVRRRMMLTAGGTGAVTGLGGAAGWVLDVPALLVLALEGIHRSALCYGFEPEDDQVPLAIFSLAAANNMREKQAAWQAALVAQIDSRQMLGGLERSFNQSFAKHAVAVGIHQVARQLGLNLGRRKVLGMVPLAGALVGGSVNAWYLRDVVMASRYVFHALRLAPGLAAQGAASV